MTKRSYRAVWFYGLVGVSIALVVATVVFALTYSWWLLVTLHAFLGATGLMVVVFVSANEGEAKEEEKQ